MEDKKQQPIIGVYDPQKEVKEAISKLQKQQKNLNQAMVAVMVVVAVGFVAIVIEAMAIFMDHQNYAAQRYEEYIQLLQKQENLAQQKSINP